MNVYVCCILLLAFGAGLNVAYFRQDLDVYSQVNNYLIDGGQPRAKNGFLNVIWLHFT